MDIQIRKAIPEDAEILIKIYNAAFYEDYVRYGVCPAYGRSVNDMRISIIEVPKHIAFFDSKPIGVISVKQTGDHVYYIGCLCVIP